MKISFTIQPISIVLFFIFLLLLMSCTQHLVPNAQRINEQRVPEVTLSQKITIINIQPSTEEITFLSGVISFKGNLKEWTDEAVRLLKLEIQKRGASLSLDAEKVIKLSITEAKLVQGAMRLRCDLNLHVETGNGYSADYYVENLSGGDHARASGGAITLALTEMFNDEKIISYLK